MLEHQPEDEILRRHARADVPADVETRMHRQFAEFRTGLDRRRGPVYRWLSALLDQRPLRWTAAAGALATVVAIVFVWGGDDGSRVYAATVSRLTSARSVQYTMEVAPFVSVEFSRLAPSRERIKTSWGIEIRTDGSGTQLVLLHGSKQFLREEKGAAARVAQPPDLIEQLTSLPKTADSMLGQRTVNGRRLVGYQVMGSRMSGSHGVERIDLWLDADSGALDHVDVTPSGAGASGYQMHITNIRIDADLDAELFDMAPPAGYSDAASDRVSERRGPDVSTGVLSAQPRVTRANPQSAVVIPMTGSYEQAATAVANVARHLQERGIVAAGPAFGRFESESHWDAGYPVPAGATVAPPFEVVTVPGGPVASLAVDGPWGRDSAARWSRLIAWLGEHGYVAVGPPTEVWSGDESRPDAQVTEMRIAVAPGRR